MIFNARKEKHMITNQSRSEKLICLILIVLFSSLEITSAQQFLDRTILHDGEQREYKIYIPDSYDNVTPFPLLFNFHGGNGDIASQIAISDMRSIADTANFIIVYPQALPDPNDGGSTNWLHKDPSTIDDIFFVEAMIEEISNNYRIDLDRIYACGYSLGGEFTFELGCRLNDKIAAIGVVARTMSTSTLNLCNPSHPTGVLTILGTDDFISPYEGLTFNGIQYYISADEVHDYWIGINNTTNQANITNIPNTNTIDGSTVERFSWNEGDNCVTVEHLKVLGGGHDWPGSFGNMDIDASTEIWNYVSNYSLNGFIGCGSTQVEENTFDHAHLKIYPNPSQNILNIKLEINIPTTFQILTLSGEVIKSGLIYPNNKTISINTLASNHYILRIKEKAWKFEVIK